MKHENDQLNLIKAVPVITSELERVQSDFKFYSPAEKSYQTAHSPKEGEVWRLERTLPSALYLGIKWTRTEEAYGLGRYLLMHTPLKPLVRQTPGRFKREGYDFRKLQYNPEEYLDQYPLLSIINQWETFSIAWHPTKKWLATAGIGNQAKLWDVEDGSLVTENPMWDTSSTHGTTPYEGTLSWSPDGVMFISVSNSYDGQTGEYLTLNLLKHSSTYSNQEYGYLRGGRESINHNIASPYSATSNFSPWRPNSEQFLNGHNEEHLILRNRRTGEVEKVIDYDVESQIKDFAWHPRGRFIAVTFERNNIRIIDVEKIKIIDDLSVQHLVGWNPDGKILVARKEIGKDDFVIWDALAMKEAPMPEEMKNELWFKRFFKNISADGLRYVKVEHDENYVRSTNIYSVASDELVATLPKPITSAAWSPVDGGLLATCGGRETHIWRI